MSIFSTNQARQFYVVSGLVNSGVIDSTHRIAANASVGTIGINHNSTHMWFEYMGAGGLTRSDLIPLNHVRAVTKTAGTAMRRNLNAVKVTLNSSMIDDTVVEGGQDCILNITIPNYENGGTEYKLLKFGAAHTYATMSPSDFYVALACSIYGGISRDAVKAFNVFLTDGTNDSAVTSTKKDDYTDDDYTGIILVENEQPWSRGKIAQYEIEMQLSSNTVIVDGEEINWLVTDYTVNDEGDYGYIKNSKMTADLEWFCMGERGDIYRGAGWPLDIPTTYQVDPTVEYDYLDIHYFFQGEGVSVQQSEKTITVVASNATSSAIMSAIEDVIEALPLTNNGLTPEGNITFS